MMADRITAKCKTLLPSARANHWVWLC
jgi:hypothetical protein